MSRSSEESIGESQTESAPDSRPTERPPDPQPDVTRNPDRTGPERELPSRPEKEPGQSIERAERD